MVSGSTPKGVNKWEGGEHIIHPIMVPIMVSIMDPIMIPIMVSIMSTSEDPKGVQ